MAKEKDQKEHTSPQYPRNNMTMSLISLTTRLIVAGTGTLIGQHVNRLSGMAAVTA